MVEDSIPHVPDKVPSSHARRRGMLRFNLEFFDNLTIAALVAYEWNTIGFTYWAVRFVPQCIFYASVVTEPLLQVYNQAAAAQIGLFITIIVAAVFFLWLELLQTIHSWSRYVGSGYNVLDVVAFAWPLGASIHQLVLVYTDNEQGTTRPLSFAVLIDFLHMGGRYDPVSPFFETEGWWFHIMMIVFFFSTVIVLLNMLIARLWYIKSAENMSYLIPGFRKTQNVFPKRIYFTASKDEVKKYRRKYFSKQKKLPRRWGNDDEEDAGVEDEFMNTPLPKVDEYERQTVNGGNGRANASSETLPESVSDDGSGDKEGRKGDFYEWR
ncbi:hypothetical protein BGZ47_009756 [Haplosporangium gracile]|nr:hypothetical protein BGZ47_009756 [Haplosporangium gracile]